MRAKTLLELGRISNLPTVWSNVLAGAVLSGAPLRLEALGLAAFAGSAFYVGGMFLNDAFDAEIDARERPERPIPSGRASRGAVFAIGFSLLALGLLVLGVSALSGRAVSGLGLVAAGLFTAVCVVIYDRWHKGVAASPVVMGLCRAGLYGIGVFSVSSTLNEAVGLGAITLALYVLGLTHVARFETASRVARAWPSAFVVAPLALAVLRQGGSGAPASWIGLCIALLAITWVIFALRLALLGGRNIGSAVVALIAGISLVDAAQMASVGRPLFALFGLMAFGLTLLGQRFVRGT